MKAMEKKATPMPEELEREWNEVRVCFRLLQCRRARIVTKRMLDGSVKRYTEVRKAVDEMVQREEMYFEPRCVGSDLRIRWYGEQYSAPELERHYEETVYIRDSGKELMVYSMEQTAGDEKRR